MHIRPGRKWLIIFLACLIICLLAVACLLIAVTWKYGSAVEGIKLLGRYAFSDFGQVMYFTLCKNPYTSDFSTMYTPLNFLFYLPFALICGRNPAFYTLSDVSVEEYNLGIVQTWEFWVSFLLYFFVIFICLFFTLKKRLPVERLSDKIFLFLSICFSSLTAYAFIRGSNIYIALVFYVLYLNTYKSEKRWQRELSLVFLAIAGIMKVYLLFGGVLILKDRRWRDVVKCVLYCLVLLFVPFFMYEHPFETMSAYLGNLFSFSTDSARIGGVTNFSAYNLAYRIFELFGAEGSAGCTAVCWILTAGAFVLGLIVCLFTQKMFTALLVMETVFALVPMVSYLYVLCFMFPVFLEFMKVWREFSRGRRIFYVIFFVVVMFTPFMVAEQFWVYTLFLFAALVLECISVFRGERRERKAAGKETADAASARGSGAEHPEGHALEHAGKCFSESIRMYTGA